MTIKSDPDVIIFEGNYPAWPWITRDVRGVLYCLFREDGIANRKDSGHGYSPLGRLMLTRSTDAGHTWVSPPTVVADNDGYDDCGGGIAVMPNESLLVSYFSRFSSGGYSQAWVIQSNDAGMTWTDSIPTSDQDTRARSAPLAMSNGEILVPIYRSMFSELGQQSIAAVSSDAGRTWTNFLVPNAPDGELNEWDVLEVEPGRVIGIHRDEGQACGCFWKTESHDWGRNWTAPIQTNVWDVRSSSPPHLDFHGGRVVLTYANARGLSVSMVSSADPEFALWDMDGRVVWFQYRTDGRPIADASYPCSVAVGPHLRFIVDYEIESLIAPDPSSAITYQIESERKQITGHFVDTPHEWGAHAL